MTSKNPRDNGWKYKTFNLNDIEHAATVQMYKDCSERYGLKQKTIFMTTIKMLHEYGTKDTFFDDVLQQVQIQSIIDRK